MQALFRRDSGAITTASGEEESGRRVRNRNHGILVALKNESGAVFCAGKKKLQ